MSSENRTNLGSAIVHRIDNKRARTLKVSNERESLQLKKLSKSLHSLKLVNDNLLKREERKMKGKLAKLTDVSTSGLNSNIYQNPTSIISLQAQCDGMDPDSANPSNESSATSHSDHLLKFPSFLKQPFRRLSSTEKKKSKYDVPFSGAHFNIGINTTIPKNDSRLINPNMPSSSLYVRASHSQGLSQEPRSISIQEANAMLPSQNKLSGEKFPHDHGSGNPAFELKLKELLKAWQEGKGKRTSNFPYIQPDDVLRCRYLRLTESNISTLLQKCEESGMYIDIHPHMKESDIDVNTLMSSGNINTVAL
ncbi:uncharacterized protein C16orf78 homolog [Mixophyes fleayi]|uniref:uncharacterized protein C16orf78 homolog n=1 Tax=Mixophyes fleayi TaxID=3061075 RepID=UPI003F4DA456